MELCLRDALCEGKGGFANFLASHESQLRLAFDRQRQSKPLAQQKTTIEAPLTHEQKATDEADADLQKLQRQRADFDSKTATRGDRALQVIVALASHHFPTEHQTIITISHFIHMLIDSAYIGSAGY